MPPSPNPGPVRGTPLPTALQPQNVALATIAEAMKAVGKQAKESSAATTKSAATWANLTKGVSAATAIAGAATSALTRLTGAIGSQIASFVKMYNPAAVNRFEMASRDLSAAIGRALLPLLERMTVVVRGVGDAVALLGPVGQAFIAGAVGAAVALGVLSSGTAGATCRT